MDEKTRPSVENGNSSHAPFGDANEIFDEIEKAALSWTKTATQAIRKYPLQSVALGLAVGALAGALLRNGRPSGK